MDVAEHAERLVSRLRSYRSCAVALSGGVDSAVVLKAARLALGDRAVAVVGVGPALAERELADARALAERIGAPLVEVATTEIQRPGYVANGPDRCYHCKTDLYGELTRVAQQHGLEAIANGANTDDLGDHRPGAAAAAEFAVRSPLQECGFDKAAVRALAAHWDLPVAEKPASPCLASRLAYGVPVTDERLRRVEAAEALLRSLGVADCRVRCHEGELARIEAPASEVPRLAAEPLRLRLADELRRLGFRYVAVDLAGMRSGSLNDVLPVETLGVWRSPDARTSSRPPQPDSRPPHE